MLQCIQNMHTQYLQTAIIYILCLIGQKNNTFWVPSVILSYVCSNLSSPYSLIHLLQPLLPLLSANWISAQVSAVLGLTHADTRWLSSQIQRLFSRDLWHYLLLFRTLSSSSRRATSTWLSTTSRCCTMESWPAPSPSPTMPRRRTPSFAWSRRPGRTPPSLSTHHMPSCYRLVSFQQGVLHSNLLFTATALD